MRIDFKKLREEEGITPEDIAVTLGISQTYVSLLLNGKRRMSQEKWDLLKSKYCNITKYVINDCNEIDDKNDCNITNDGCDNVEDEETLIPAFILKMHNDERKRFDAQMDKVLQQNDEMLAQNRILVEALRDQMRYLQPGYSSQVADTTTQNYSQSHLEININKDDHDKR